MRGTTEAAADMGNQEFRDWAHRAAEWSADYLDTVADRPVRAQVRPGEIAGALPAEPPETGEAMAAIFADFERIVVPGMTHWQHPRFFAYFPANSSPPSIVAEYLTAAMAAQCMLWQTSPAATELETRVLDWLRKMIGLPNGFCGVIQDSASGATLAALLTARERALGFGGNREGLSGQPPVRVYCSAHAHSSVDKAVRIAGIGDAHLVKVPVHGERFGMDSDALDRAIRADRGAGRLPAAVARRHGLFLHVDAAWAGSAMICPEFRDLMKGVDEADSFVFNPHKWLFTNFDCSAHFVKDPNALTDTLGIRPPFLRTLGKEGFVDYSEWSLPLGRRFRALKLWFVIRSYGVEALQEMIRRHVAWAEELAALVDGDPAFELVTPPILSLFSFRYAPPGAADVDALNQALVERINDDGRIYVTQTRHDEKFVIRFQVGQTSTTRADVMLAWDVIRAIADRLPRAVAAAAQAASS